MNTLIISSKDTMTVMFPNELDQSGRPSTHVLKKEDWDSSTLQSVPQMDYDTFVKTFDNRSEEVKEIDRTLENYRTYGARYHGVDQFVEVSEGTFHHVKVQGLSLPYQLFREMLMSLHNADYTYYDSLVMFWMRCALNNNPQSRDDLFKFIKNNGFYLTPQGLLYTFRSVCLKSTDTDKLSGVDLLDHHQMTSLIKFVVKSYHKQIKWKKSPKNKVVFRKDGDKFVLRSKGKAYKAGWKVGNLERLYKLINNSDTFTFTDSYTKKMIIKMNHIVEIDRRDCNYNNESPCSEGLHVGSPSFVEESSGAYGDVNLCVLVNPTDVVAVPKYDNMKMRTCRYLPISFVTSDNITPPRKSAESQELSRTGSFVLEKMLKNSSLLELQAHRVLPDDLSMGVFNSVRSSIKEMNEIVKNRSINYKL